MKKMKKIAAMVVTIALALSLTGCVSEEVKAVSASIDAIGTVTLNSEADIIAAREGYDALPEEDKAKVKNYDVLVAAEQALVVARFNDNAEAYLAGVDALLMVVDEFYGWVELAWSNASAVYAEYGVEVNGDVMETFMTNCEFLYKESMVEVVRDVLGEDILNTLKVQSWAMHVNEPLPQKTSGLTTEKLQPAFAKNMRLYELKQEHETMVSAVTEEALAPFEAFAQLPEYTAAVERVNAAVLAYSDVVVNSVSLYPSVEDYAAACAAARAELDSAIADLLTLMEG